jgi:hydrogenase small subunit
MSSSAKSLCGQLQAQGISRREFLRFCSVIAATLALPLHYTRSIAAMLGQRKKPAVLWLELQGCTGCTESFARADHPGVAQAVLESISLDYHETLMAAAGKQAEMAQVAAMKENWGNYILIVEGSVPTGEEGVYCTIGGKPAIDILKTLSEGAAFVVAVGTCACYGGLPAARPNPTLAKGVDQVVQGKTIINIPGCPPIGDVIMATVVHYLLFSRAPSLDAEGRPLFAYGKTIHEMCRRRAQSEAGEMVAEWDDEEHRRGACLWPLGCKGPVTRNACPVMRWNMGTSWCVGSGHPCVGCSERDFWDKLTPIYTTTT